MATQVFFRDPFNYIRELVEVGASNIIWERGTLIKRAIDPIKHAKVYYGETPYRILATGGQGTVEYDNESTLEKPKAVYPSWSFGQQIPILEELMDQPVGADEDLCNMDGIAVDERPVYGQEHRVVIRDIPKINSGVGREFMRILHDMQVEYPECILHIHGIYSFRMQFGMQFGAADVEPRSPASKGSVTLPVGREVKYEATQSTPHWVTMFGYRPVDLAEPRVRCMYNIKAAIWAGENFDSEANPRTTKQPGTTASTSRITNVAALSPVRLKKALPGDKEYCDSCSLADNCKQYRAGSVCTLPGSDTKSLVNMFGSRNPDSIIDGLGALMATQVGRAEKGMSDEDLYGELSPEVTKILNQMFSNGVKLAKLIDPARFTPGSKINVLNLQGAGTNTSANPRQLVAGVIRELEQRGISREDITPQMIENFMGKQQELESGEVLEAETID